jgi:hypothetical protein
MEVSTLWNVLLSFVSGLLLWGWKSHMDEVKRLQILLNRTREEIAREYVTKEEVHADINRVMTRLEVLDAKLDRLIEGYRPKGQQHG